MAPTGFIAGRGGCADFTPPKVGRIRTELETIFILAAFRRVPRDKEHHRTTRRGKDQKDYQGDKHGHQGLT
jgi:hypothetical protein